VPSQESRGVQPARDCAQEMSNRRHLFYLDVVYFAVVHLACEAVKRMVGNRGCVYRAGKVYVDKNISRAQRETAGKEANGMGVCVYEYVLCVCVCLCVCICMCACACVNMCWETTANRRQAFHDSFVLHLRKHAQESVEKAT